MVQLFTEQYGKLTTMAISGNKGEKIPGREKFIPVITPTACL
ncbi:hypothetical protein [Chitinophaga oryzae]|nr:hypothetical protein [Chitinophaga oryzae]